MSKKNNDRILPKVFTVIKELADVLSTKMEFLIDLELISTNGIKNVVRINGDNAAQIKINRNIIIIENLVLSIEEIVKLKILNINPYDEIRDTFMIEMENILRSDATQEYKNVSYHRGNNITPKDKNIDRYIEENKDNIKSISLRSIKNDTHINSIKSVEKDDILSYNTSIEIKRKPVIDKIDINTEKSNVITSIDEKKEKVIKSIDKNEKLVLTNNAKEVEVAKPIEVESVDVLTDIHIDNCNLVTNQSPTKAVKDIKEQKSEAIVDAKPIYAENIIGNIDINSHLITPEKVDILFIEPSNKNINKEEVKDRYITFDPTGENYIGVVLDDGTFEPLKVSMKTITVLPSDVKNILVNIDKDKNIVNHVIKDIDYSKSEFTNSLEVEYKDNLLEYDENNETPATNIISKSSKEVNNIINKDETVSVVTKKDAELITGIKNIEYDLVSKIDNIERSNVIKGVKLEETKNYVIEDVKLDKQLSKTINNIEITKENVSMPFEENIDGNIELVGSGLLIVQNNDFGITIYPTSKISSVL